MKKYETDLFHISVKIELCQRDELYHERNKILIFQEREKTSFSILVKVIHLHSDIKNNNQ